MVFVGWLLTDTFLLAGPPSLVLYSDTENRLEMHSSSTKRLIISEAAQANPERKDGQYLTCSSL